MSEVDDVETYCWPEFPALPACGRPVVLRVAVPKARADARRMLREALRQMLAAWSGLRSEQLPLEETPRGPVWNGLLRDATLDIGLSYVRRAGCQPASGQAGCQPALVQAGWQPAPQMEGWIGLLRGGRIGVDVMEAERFAELEGVAQSFLNPEAAADIRGAADPALTFAAAWTEREARLKCLKRGLSEWTAGDAQAEAECACRRLVLGQRLVGAVCWLG
jgi:hypothetical protein